MRSFRHTPKQAKMAQAPDGQIARISQPPRRPSYDASSIALIQAAEQRRIVVFAGVAAVSSVSPTKIDWPGEQHSPASHRSCGAAR